MAAPTKVFVSVTDSFFANAYKAALQAGYTEKGSQGSNPWMVLNNYMKTISWQYAPPKATDVEATGLSDVKTELVYPVIPPAPVVFQYVPTINAEATASVMSGSVSSSYQITRSVTYDTVTSQSYTFEVTQSASGSWYTASYTSSYVYPLTGSVTQSYTTSYTIAATNDVYFNVYGTGTPPIYFQWYTGSLPLQSGSRFQNTNSGSLKIVSASADLVGTTYWCRIGSSNGVTTSSFFTVTTASYSTSSVYTTGSVTSGSVRSGSVFSSSNGPNQPEQAQPIELPTPD